MVVGADEARPVPPLGTVLGEDEEVHGRAAVLAGVDAIEELREVVEHAAEWG